jgi:hypothetical protein
VGDAGGERADGRQPVRDGRLLAQPVMLGDVAQDDHPRGLALEVDELGGPGLRPAQRAVGP